MSDADGNDLELRTRDGRRLHGERFGAGDPVVLFEAGMGASRNSWGAVVPAVAERTAAVVYDRSGLGRSPRDPGPRPLAKLVDDLVDVLGQLGDGPVVLVGHSWGGPIIRCAAAQEPERIAGLVLVDQTDEGCDLFFSKANERQVAFMKPILPVLARSGALRLGVEKLAASLPEPWATAMIEEDGTVASARVQVDEVADNVDDLRRLRDDPPVLPDVPVSIISGTRNGFLERNRRGELIAAHRARAEALPQGRHVEATSSSHYVPFTDAPLVVDEILRTVDHARSTGGT